MLTSGWIWIVVLLLVVLGYGIVHMIANRKWGYTPKREKELENIEDDKIKKNNLSD